MNNTLFVGLLQLKELLEGIKRTVAEPIQEIKKDKTLLYKNKKYLFRITIPVVILIAVIVFWIIGIIIYMATKRYFNIFIILSVIGALPLWIYAIVSFITLIVVSARLKCPKCKSKNYTFLNKEFLATTTSTIEREVEVGKVYATDKYGRRTGTPIGVQTKTVSEKFHQNHYVYKYKCNDCGTEFTRIK